MPIVALLPFLLPMIPVLIDAATQIYQTAMADPETTEEKRAHYARIVAALDAVTVAVQDAPLPPVGSGR